MKSGNARSDTSRAIAFTLREGTNENILTRIYQMLRRAEIHADITESILDGTIYVEPFTTRRAQTRAIGILRGFCQIEQSSVRVVTIDEVENLFNNARRNEEKKAQFFPV